MRHWRHGYKTPALSQMEFSVALVNNFKTVNYYHKELFILDVAVVLDLDPSLK